MPTRRSIATALVLATLAGAPSARACGEGDVSLEAVVYDADLLVRAVAVRETEDAAGRFVDLRIQEVLYGRADGRELRVWTFPRSVAGESGIALGTPVILGLHLPRPGEYFAQPRFGGAAIPVSGGILAVEARPGLEAGLRRLIPAARAARRGRGKAGGSPLATLLPQLLEHPDPRMRLFAVRAFSGERPPQAEARRLVAAFRREASPRVARAYVELFRGIRLREAASAVAARALATPDPVLAEEAVGALSELGDRTIAAELLPGALTGPAPRRARAIRAIGALRIPETVGVLRAALADPATRDAAVAALADLSTSEAVATLERLARGDGRLRARAARALHRARTREAAAALRRLAASGGRALPRAITRRRRFGGERTSQR